MIVGGAVSLKVLIVAPFFPSEAMPYAGNFIAEQARALLEIGANLEVVTFVPSTPWPLPLISSKWRNFACVPAHYEWANIPVKVYRCPTLPRNLSLDLSSILMERVLLRRAKDFQPNMIHVHFAYPTGCAAVRCGKQMGIPSFLTVHGSDVHSLPQLCDKYRKGVIEAIQETNLVLAVSDSLRDAAAMLSKRQDIKVHRIGIDLLRFAPTDRAAARSAVAEISLLPGQVVLFVGNLLQTKGVLDLLSAMSEIKDVGTHLVYVGAGPLAAEIVRQARVLELQDRVHLLGPRPNSEVPMLINAADVVVLPSYKEGLPISLVEALACEKPVIASSVGGIPEVIVHNRTGLLVPPANSKALARDLRRLLADAFLSRALARAGRSMVEAQYDLKRNTRELMDLYRQEGR